MVISSDERESWYNGCDQMDFHRSVMAVRVPSQSVISAVIQLSMVTTVIVSTWTILHLPVRQPISSTQLEALDHGTMEPPLLLVLSALTMRALPTMTPHFVTLGILLMLVGFLTNVIT